MASQDLEDGFDEVEFVDEFDGDEPSQPWHNSTGAVVGASAAGIAVIGVLVASVMFVTGRSEPDAPADFTDPSFTATASEAPTTTTTATITSTPPVSTTEINAPIGPPTTSGSSATSSSVSSEPSTPATSRPRQREGGESPGGPTSRRPRFNITRTLPPQQAG